MTGRPSRAFNLDTYIASRTRTLEGLFINSFDKLSCLTRWKSVLQCQLSFASSRLREDCCCAAFQSPCHNCSHELLLSLMDQCRESLLFVMKLFVFNLSIWQERCIYSFLLFTKEMTSDHATFLSGCLLPKKITAKNRGSVYRFISL